MWHHPENDHFVDELLLAGQRAQPGLYKEIGTGRLIQLEEEDALPATLDGRIACYLRMGRTWGQLMSDSVGQRKGMQNA